MQVPCASTGGRPTGWAHITGASGCQTPLSKLLMDGGRPLISIKAVLPQGLLRPIRLLRFSKMSKYDTALGVSEAADHVLSRQMRQESQGGQMDVRHRFEKITKARETTRAACVSGEAESGGRGKFRDAQGYGGWQSRARQGRERAQRRRESISRKVASVGKREAVAQSARHA